MSSSSAEESALAVKQTIAQCEQEIAAIKARLRSLQSAATATEAEGNGKADEDANQLTVTWIKTEGLPEAAQPKLTLQLSSPVEEATLSKVFDPLDESTDTPAEDGPGASYTFVGVETGQATLTVSAMDADIPLGSSTAYDLAPLTRIDVLQPKEEYTHELAVAIVAEAKEEATEEEQEEEAAVAGAQAESAICTVTLKVQYKPSIRDQREELYDLLNKTSQRKSSAIDDLRRLAIQAASNREAAAGKSARSGPSKSAAVQPGFLNKKKIQAEPTLWERYYARANAFVSNILLPCKNYIIFFGAVGWFHFQGQMLALPPPV